MTRWEQRGLHWTESGNPDSPVLVLSHVLGATLDMWEPQMAVLSERSHVIRYDQWGHGGSLAADGPVTLADLGADVLALLDHVGADAASFMGIGLGGLVGLWLGSHAPERITGLTISGTSAFPAGDQDWLDLASTVREQGTSGIASVTVESWFTPHFREFHALETAEFAAMIASTDDETYASCCEMINAVDLRADLAAITAPTLVLAGSDDPLIALPAAEALADGIGSNARLEVLTHSAHLATAENANVVNELLVSGVAGPSQ